MNSKLRIAYIVAAHHKPEMVIRLVRRLYSPAHLFLIHYNQRSSDREYAQLVKNFEGLSNVCFLKRQKMRWAEIGLTLASLSGIQTIAGQDLPYDYTILLTGQDYPIKSNEEIVTFLTEANGTSFMESAAWPIPDWEKGRGIRRINNFHYQLPLPISFRKFGWPPNRQHITIPARRKVPGSLHPFFGSSWWCLSKACVKYIYEYTEAHPDYTRFFKYVYSPDECFYQILLMNSHLAPTIQPRTLTYVDWSRTPYPAIMNSGDLSNLLKSDCLFARKFDSNLDVCIMNDLDVMHTVSEGIIEGG